MATLRYRVLLRRQFRKPDIFRTSITSCSAGQKAGLIQSSSTQSHDLPIHTDYPQVPMYVTHNQYAICSYSICVYFSFRNDIKGDYCCSTSNDYKTYDCINIYFLYINQNDLVTSILKVYCPFCKHRLFQLRINLYWYRKIFLKRTLIKVFKVSFKEIVLHEFF